MTSLASPTLDSGITESVRAKLQAAPGPLKFAEVLKGLPKQKGVKAPQAKTQVQELLDEEVRLGRVFSQPSAKNGEARYWWRDERQYLRDKAIELTTTPLPMSTFKTKLGKEVKGVDGEFIAAVVKDLLEDDRLYEHPPKTKSGPPLFGASRPRPLDKHKKAMDKLIADCNKLLSAASVPLEDLLRALRSGLVQESPRSATSLAEVGESNPSPEQVDEPRRSHRPEAELVSLEDMILKAVAETPVMSLAGLRAEMPREYQGQAFDDAVLRLADDLQVTVSKDAEASRFSEQEAAAYVRDGGHLYTTIMARS